MYVLMKEDYRISRNIRASWYFSNLDTVIPFVPRKSLVSLKLRVVMHIALLNIAL